MDQPFSPQGPCILVGTTATLIQPFGPASTYRIRNLSASVQYFTVGRDSTVTSAGAPAANTPSTNTVGMLGNSVETFGGLLPYMIASSATGFEVIPGSGV